MGKAKTLCVLFFVCTTSAVLRLEDYSTQPALSFSALAIAQSPCLSSSKASGESGEEEDVCPLHPASPLPSFRPGLSELGLTFDIVDYSS